MLPPAVQGRDFAAEELSLPLKASDILFMCSHCAPKFGLLPDKMHRRPHLIQVVVQCRIPKGYPILMLECIADGVHLDSSGFCE